MTDKLVDVCLTSSGRIDLLEQTINSFMAINTHPINQFYMTEDCMNGDIYDLVKAKWEHQFDIHFNIPKMGQSKSIDILYNKSQAEYIFHLESDWFFDKNPNFIRDSIVILEENPNIHQVWVRHKSDHNHPIEPDIYSTENFAVQFQLIKHGYLHFWNGFSWNPGLRRKKDYVDFFPNGYAEHGSEFNNMLYTHKFNYRAATLINTACYHIGYHRHTEYYVP